MRLLGPVTWYKMDSPVHKEDEIDMDKIYVDLEQLKKQINHFIYSINGINVEEPRQKKIKSLTMKTKRLLVQHKEVKKQLDYYENLYKQALISNAKSLRTDIKHDKTKLEELKEKCKGQGVHVDVALFKVKPKKRKKSKRSSVIVPIDKKRSMFNGKGVTIKDKIKIKMRTKKRSTGKKIFKQKGAGIKDNIRIQIKKNETGQRKLFFFKSDKTMNERFSNLVQKTRIEPLNFRECRITLQKLTEEQAKRYTSETNPELRKDQQISSASSLQSSKSKSPSAKQNWRIRIPKTVLEESQKETQNSKVESTMKVWRTRTTDKQYKREV